MGESGQINVKKKKKKRSERLKHFLTQYTKINSNGLNTKFKTGNYKTLTIKHRWKTLWHVIAIFFLYLSPQAKATKEKQRDLIKLKSFCTEKDIIEKMKRKPTEWKKIFANDV